MMELRHSGVEWRPDVVGVEPQGEHRILMETQAGKNHIPDPLAGNWFLDDPQLVWLAHQYGGSQTGVAYDALAEMGNLLPSVIEPLAAVAEQNPPVLLGFDPRGERIDTIRFHPAYRELEQAVVSFGLVRSAHTSGWRGLSSPLSRPMVALMFSLITEADQAQTGCPIGMMDAMAWALTHTDPVLAARYVPALAGDGDSYKTAAMFLTEKAGGADVGANETVATDLGDGVWSLSGEKWFASCPHSDLVLATARPVGAAPGTAGLGLFLVPALWEDGSRNGIWIDRLKDKFGTRAMPSGEVRLENAKAFQVGRLDLGMKQMLTMINVARVDIVAAAAGGLRRCSRAATDYARQRITFGRPLVDHPLMWQTLARLQIESTAALSAAVWAAEALEQEGGPGKSGASSRMLTPLLKAWTTETARKGALSAMEAIGGNGFIEDWGIARIARDVAVHSIWEGPGNIMHLDVLRGLRKGFWSGFREELGGLISRGASNQILEPLAAVLKGELLALDGLAATILEANALKAEALVALFSHTLVRVSLGCRLMAEAASQITGQQDGYLGWVTAAIVAGIYGEENMAAFLAHDWAGQGERILLGTGVAPGTAALACSLVATTAAGPGSVIHPQPRAAAIRAL